MEQTPLLTDAEITQRTEGHLNSSNMPPSVFRRRTDDIATGMRLARLFYEVNPNKLEQARKSDREVIQALCDALSNVRGEAFANVIPDGFTPNPSAIEVVHIADNALSLAKSQCGIEPKTEQRCGSEQ